MAGTVQERSSVRDAISVFLKTSWTSCEDPMAGEGVEKRGDRERWQCSGQEPWWLTLGSQQWGMMSGWLSVWRKQHCLLLV